MTTLTCPTPILRGTKAQQGNRATGRATNILIRAEDGWECQSIDATVVPRTYARTLCSNITKIRCPDIQEVLIPSPRREMGLGLNIDIWDNTSGKTEHWHWDDTSNHLGIWWSQNGNLHYDSSYKTLLLTHIASETLSLHLDGGVSVDLSSTARLALKQKVFAFLAFKLGW